MAQRERSADLGRFCWTSAGYRDDLMEGLGKRLGGTPGALSASRLLAGRRADSTVKARESKWRSWLAFCREESRCPLPASESDVLAYIGYLNLKRTLKAQPLSGYLSEINVRHLENGLQPPARSELVKMAKDAFRAMDPRERPARCVVGSEWMQDILLLGQAALRRRVPQDIDWVRVRDCALAVFTFLTFSRGTMSASARTAAIEITRSELSWRIESNHPGRKMKGRDSVTIRRHRRHVPFSCYHPLDLLAAWRLHRRGYAGHAFWALSETDACGGFSHTFVTQRMRALVQLLLVERHSALLASHGFRRGAASAAIAIGVPDAVIAHHADWKIGGHTLRSVYWGPPVSFSVSSFIFFGDLLSPTLAQVAAPSLMLAFSRAEPEHSGVPPENVSDGLRPPIL